uniref:RxLR effector candidate protein n=1 Tax=Hyaloperonospora arabidopsidis (strain Emoy2) TaxID=559515 RepID=M4C248_HYAAE
MLLYMIIFMNIINLYDNILINKYQELITCNRLTPLQILQKLSKQPGNFLADIANLTMQSLVTGQVGKIETTRFDQIGGHEVSEYRRSHPSISLFLMCGIAVGPQTEDSVL